MSRGLVHEIRNHLAVAIANVEAFRDGVLEPTPARLDAILIALTEVEVLLRDLPRGEVPGGRAIDLCAVVNTELAAFAPTAAEKGIAFAVRPCEHGERACETFSGDPIRIAEIVDNVVATAIRATVPGARLEVDCRGRDGTLTIVASEVRARRDEDGETRARFPLVQRFVELQGGRVEQEPVGAGMRLTVTLPGTTLAPTQR